jgi:hypothetical protein
MARFYTNENIPAQVVAELRRLGHDVMTSLDAGNANAAVPDHKVLVVRGGKGPDSPNPQSPPLSAPSSAPNDRTRGHRRLYHSTPIFVDWR